MASIRVNSQGKLFFDFYYRNVRCREYTLLGNNKRNRHRLERILRKIEKEISQETFNYRSYFPNSKRSSLFEPMANFIPETEINEMQSESNKLVVQRNHSVSNHSIPLFNQFADLWYREKEITWKRSQKQKVVDILCKHINPRFRARYLNEITKTEILDFRVYLAREYRDGHGLSSSRINQILNTLRQILEEASDRFGFPTPFRGIKPLKVQRTQVDPFSFEEVKVFLANVPERYRNYFTVAFFTGMRTSELIGLKTRYLDFDRREIHVRETFVHGHEDTPKTDGSERVIHMSSLVEQALRDEVSKADVNSKFVFHNSKGIPLNYRNLTRRIWYPTLQKLELRKRRPYQTRHTAATLWLAAGENPEWIARQLGHTTTKMLFTVYSRYVPDLTRRDGSAMEQLLATQLGK